MKRMMIAVAVFLTGCQFLAPDRYDGAEFGVYAEVWQWGQRLGEICGDRDAELAMCRRECEKLQNQLTEAQRRLNGKKDAK